MFQFLPCVGADHVEEVKLPGFHSVCLPSIKQLPRWLDPWPTSRRTLNYQLVQRLDKTCPVLQDRQVPGPWSLLFQFRNQIWDISSSSSGHQGLCVAVQCYSSEVRLTCELSELKLFIQAEAGNVKPADLMCSAGRKVQWLTHCVLNENLFHSVARSSLINKIKR